ncbi:MAG: hypothetical protein VYD05_04010 [Planctomycetota bacterium]|nr:hypothetical protein [Planctomycetota bacterium]
MSASPTTNHGQPLRGDAGPVSSGTIMIDRSLMVRALLRAITALAVAGGALGLLLFGGDQLLGAASLPYYVTGLVAAAIAMLLTLWLHGRFASTQMPGATSHAVSARLTGLLAAGMAVKMGLLVLGFLYLKQFPLGAEPAKFSEITTFAVTFVGGALLCQIGTALTLARALGRRPTTT